MNTVSDLLDRCEAAHESSPRDLLSYDISAVSWPGTKAGPVRTVGVVCWNTFGGGAERASLLWARFAMDELKIKIVWFCVECDRRADEDLTRGITFVKLPRPGGGRWRRFQDEITARDVDTCLFADHSIWMTYADILAAKACGCRTIFVLHNCFFSVFDDCNPLLYRLREKLLPCVDVVTALSPANVAWLQATGLRNAVYMPNFLTFGLEGSVPAGDRADREPPRFIFIGRLCDRKGLHYALKAFATYLRGPVGARLGGCLVVCGRFDNSGYEAQISQLLRTLKLGDAVSFAGEVKDIQDYIRQSDVLLMASRIEGAPMVLMECKAYGVPAVVFELPFVDACTEAEGVLNVPYADTEAMAAALSRIVSENGLWEKLSAAARGSLVRFAKENVAVRWKDVFGGIACGRRDWEPMCDLPDDREMFRMTMRCCSSFARPLAGHQAKLIGIENTQAWRDGRVVEAALWGYSGSYRLGHALMAPIRLFKRLIRKGRLQ